MDGSDCSGSYDCDHPRPQAVRDTTRIYLDGHLLFDHIPPQTCTVAGRTLLEHVVHLYQVQYDRGIGAILDPCTAVDPVALVERAVYPAYHNDLASGTLPADLPVLEVTEPPYPCHLCEDDGQCLLACCVCGCHVRSSSPLSIPRRSWLGQYEPALGT